MEPYKWIWSYVSRYKYKLTISLLLGLAVAAAALINPYVSGRIVGDVFQGGMLEKLGGYLIIIISVTFTRMVVRYIYFTMLEQASQDILLDLRKDIYNRIQEQNFSFFDANKVGDIMSRITGDLEAVRNMVSHVLHAAFENIVIFIVAVILMFTLNWQMTLMMLVFSPVIFYSTYKQSREIKPAYTQIRDQFATLNSVCQENISGNRVVKAFTKEDEEIVKFIKENQEYSDRNLKSVKIWVKYLPRLEFCAGMLYFVLLLVGGIFVITERMELWQLVTMNGYLWAVNDPMRISGWLVNDTQRFVASLEKIFDMMRQRIYIQNPENPIVKEKLSGEISFENVSFSYDRNNPKALVLKNLNFTALPGQTIGIVGATGSGKTTLINLIGRFYDATFGKIIVDGVDVKDYGLQSLRKGISSAGQDVFLFSDTVEGNIAYGASDAAMEHVIECAAIASADGFIKTMPEGYDTIVGERGVGLSGGQKQRISLARALAVNPSVIILDDTTSAVDMETEHEIQLALRDKYADVTKFIIAHRISSVRNADMILVVDNGEIIERGTHNELLAQQGYYFGLFTDQYGDYKEEMKLINGPQ